MPTADEWKELIEKCDPQLQVKAHSYRGIKFGSHSAPVVLGCDDGEDYVVKSLTRLELARAICNDQVMGWIAPPVNAPVPPVRIVHIPEELIQNNPELAGIPIGPAHGSRYMPNASKTRQAIAFQDVPGNRSRFAALALLYGLAGVFCDHQFFYEDGSNLVLSFDHGHFFPGGPNWTIITLAGCARAVPDHTIVTGCNLTNEEIATAASSLWGLNSENIVIAVASPPDSWKLTMEERVALANHFQERRNQLSALNGTI